MKLQELKRKLMQDPEFVTEYEALGPQYALIAQVIKLRQLRGLTQAELAERMGTKQPAISRFEAGEDNPTLEFVAKLAAAVGARLSLRLIPHD